MNKTDRVPSRIPFAQEEGKRSVLAVLACTLLASGCSKDKDIAQVEEALNSVNQRTVHDLDQCLKWKKGDLDSLVEANEASKNIMLLINELHVSTDRIGTLDDPMTRGSRFLGQLATVAEFNHSVVIPNMEKLVDCLKSFCITKDEESLCSDDALAKKFDALTGEATKILTAGIEIIESQLRVISACGIIDDRQLAEELCQYVDVEHACLPDLNKACPEVTANKKEILDTFMVLRDKISQLNGTLREMDKLGFSGSEFENLKKRILDAMVLVERAIKVLKMTDPPTRGDSKDKGGSNQHPNGLMSNSGKRLGSPAFPPNRTRDEIRRFS